MTIFCVQVVCRDMHNVTVGVQLSFMTQNIYLTTSRYSFTNAAKPSAIKQCDRINASIFKSERNTHGYKLQP